MTQGRWSRQIRFREEALVSIPLQGKHPQAQPKPFSDTASGLWCCSCSEAPPWHCSGQEAQAFLWCFFQAGIWASHWCCSEPVAQTYLWAATRSEAGTSLSWRCLSNRWHHCDMLRVWICPSSRWLYCDVLRVRLEFTFSPRGGIKWANYIRKQPCYCFYTVQFLYSILTRKSLIYLKRMQTYLEDLQYFKWHVHPLGQV